MENYLLGIDVGTGSIKVSVIDIRTRMIGIVAKEYEMVREQEDWVQMNTNSVWSALLACLRELFVVQEIDSRKICGIGISCLCPGLAAFDENNHVLIDPIIYTDRRSIEEAEYIKAAVGEERLFQLTANGAMAGAHSGTSMLWIKNHRPDIYKKTRYFGHVNTLLAVLLTGEAAIDYSNASYTNLFEVTGARTWSKELCEKVGISMAKLPPLKSATDVVGGLLNLELLQFGIAKGTPVVIGGADTACASIACGVTRHGDAFESAGTTDVITICTDQPKFDKGFINRCHVVDGTWIYQGAMSNTGASLRWAREELCKDLKAKAALTNGNPYDLMNEEVTRSRPGAGGIVFLPYMAGERCPIWDAYAKGVFFGVTLKNTRNDLERAIMEGCGYGLRQLCEIAEHVTGTNYPAFYSVGGGSRSDVWSQIKADITGKQIHILDVNEAAVIGAALLAGVGAGVFNTIQEAADKVERKVAKVFYPNEQVKEVYDQQYHVYNELYPRIKELFIPQKK